MRFRRVWPLPCVNRRYVMPKAKPFAYETLLRIRKRQEDLRAMAMAAARRDVNNAEEQRTRLAAEQRNSLERWAGYLKECLDAGEARRYHQYERHLARLIDDKDADIRRLEGIAEEKRGELLDASKRKRIVGKLKERKNAAYALELRRMLQRINDETATNYASRGEELAPDASGASK